MKVRGNAVSFAGFCSLFPNSPRYIGPDFLLYLCEGKNQRTEPKFKSAFGVVGQLFSRVACLGAVILICSSAPAQNLFVSDVVGGDIYEFTPPGVRNTFASGLNGPEGLAFDSAGNLFVADGGNGTIYKFTSAGVRSTLASGFIGPEGLAFDSAAISFWWTVAT